jgi:hypothetical protein
MVNRLTLKISSRIVETMFSQNNYEKILWTARAISVAAPVIAVIYSLSLGLAARFYSIPVGSFSGATIILFPLFIVIAFIGWKWPLIGGLLMLIIGVLMAFAIVSAAGWPGWYKIPYSIFLAVYLAGGILYLIAYCLEKQK